MTRKHLAMFAIAACLLLTGCMTPRQTEALVVLQEMLTAGVITREQFDALAAALSPSTWVSDVIAIGSSLLAGTGAYVATNLRRNSLRRARGEPVQVPVEVTAATPV